MIGAIPTSGIFAPSLTIVNVVQDVDTAIVSLTLGSGSSPTDYEFQTSVDQVTWTDRGDSFVSGNRVVDFIATPLYYRGRVAAAGAFGDWSNEFLFDSALATEAPAAPNSVTVTSVTRFVGYYRIVFTVNQPAVAPSVTNRGVFVEYEYGSGGIGFINNGFTSVGASWNAGDNSFQVDAYIDELADFKVRLNVYNSAGGYDSAEVTSDVFPETIPNQDETIEYFSTGSISVPVWATNFDYWLVGGGGGGGRGKVTSVSNDESLSLYYVGEPGTGGTVVSGNASLPITDFNVVIGTGGDGSERVFNEFATAGQQSVLRSGTISLYIASGGTAGSNETVVTVPSPPAAGNPSSNVTVDSTVYNGMPGSPVQEDAGFPLAVDFDDMDSTRITGGAGGGYGWPDAGLADGLSEVFAGGNGGAGYCKIKFKNY